MTDDADGVPEQTCQATTSSGDSCNNVADDDGYCWLHGPEDDPDVATDDGEAEAEAEDDDDTTTATVATAEPEDEDEAAVDFSDVGGFIRVQNPDDEGKKAALLHWQPGEEKVVRPGIRIKRAIERGRLEYLGPHDTETET